MLKKALKLYFSHYSPPARGVYLVIKALNLNVELEDIDILSKKYLETNLQKINPQHTIPTLKDEDFVIWDSHAIAAYLAAKYSINDTLYPKNLKRRAIVDQRLHFDTEQLYPKTYDIIHPLIFRGQTSIPKHLEGKVKYTYGILEKFLDKSSWLAGEYLTIADLCCISSISTLDFLIPVTANENPKLYEFIEKCKKLPYYHEANQSGLNLLGNKIKERLIHTYVRSLSVKS